MAAQFEFVHRARRVIPDFDGALVIAVQHASTTRYVTLASAWPMRSMPYDRDGIGKRFGAAAASVRSGKNRRC